MGPPRAAGPAPVAMVLGVLLVAAFYLWNSWNRDFWAPEEPDFAAVAKQMPLRAKAGESAPWIDPKIDGVMYAEKPPLIYWLALLSSWISGSDPRIDYRVPVALAAAVGLLVTYLAGRRFFDGRVAAAACLVQASSVLYFQCGSWFITDMLFAVGCFVALATFGISILIEPGSRWALAGWAGLAAAALAKSAPLALVLVLGPIGLFVLFNRKAGIRRQLGHLRPLAGGAIFLALVLPWYIAMYHLEGWKFIDEHFIKQHFSRLVDAESHYHPWYEFYYFKSIWADFLPWSIFIPLAAFYGWAHFRRTNVRFFAIWALFTFLVLSATSSKQGKYLLPMWPALSLLASAALLEEERESVWEEFLGLRIFQGLGWALRVPIAVVLAFGVYWAAGGDPLVFLSPFKERPWLQDARGIVADTDLFLKLYILTALSFAAAAGAGVVIHRRLLAREPYRAAACLAGTTLLIYLFFSFTYVDLNRFKSARPLGREVSRIVGDRPLAIYGSVKDRYAIRYYLDRPLGRPPKRLESLDLEGREPERERRLDEFLATPEKVYVLLTSGDLKRLLENFPKYKSRIHPVELPEGLRFNSRYAGALVTN